jgi:hypothetical protein
MRTALCAVFLLIAASAPATQERGAAAVLREMRAALGGDAALDAVKAFSLEGPMTSTFNRQSIHRTHELLAVLPDRFVRIQRLTRPDVTVFRGLNGDHPIFRIDARGVKFKTPPGATSASPEVLAGAAVRRRQEFACFSLVLFGKSIDSYPLEFAYVGREDAAGSSYDVIEATDSNRKSMRLHVDAGTHLPALLTFPGEKSLTVVEPGQTASGSPELVDRKWALSEYRKEDGVNWPRRIEELVDGDVVEDIRFRRVKLNPKVDARKFAIK